MNEQVWWTDIEVAIITAYSIILISIELAKLPKYRLPKKEREFDDLDSANELFSNKSAISGLDEAALRQKALERIMKNLDIKNKGEDMYGSEIGQNEQNPKMRYSIQNPKNPMYNDESEENFDQRRTDSEPAMKFKDYNKTPKQPKEDRKDSMSDHLNEQTEDKPSMEEEKKLDITEEDGGFTQYQDSKLQDTNLDQTKEMFDESRNGDMTQDRLNNEDNIYVEGEQNSPDNDGFQQELGSDDLEESEDPDNPDGVEDMKRTVSEKEQPLEAVIGRKGALGDQNRSKSARSEDDSRIIRASDDRGSKETSNGVLETPPPEDFDINEDLEVMEVTKNQAKPRVFYSDKSESSVESMMADTPSNYNILNGRFDDTKKGLESLAYGGSLLDKYQNNTYRDKSVITRPKLDIISEIEAPSKAPSNLNTIKHVKTTKNERNFIDSVVGSDKNSYMGDMMAGSLHGGRAVDSDRGPPSDHNPIKKTYDARSHSKSNMRNDYPTKSLEETKKMHRNLKYNQFMISNNGSEVDSAGNELDFHSKPMFKNDRVGISDPELTKELKNGLPPIRYPKLKSKRKKSKQLKLIEDKNLSITSVNDLESAYMAHNK